MSRSSFRFAHHLARSAPRVSRRAIAGVLAGTVVTGYAGYAYAVREEIRLDARGSKPASKSLKGLIPYAEVQRHNTPSDCWVVLEGKVYDLTSFAAIHPGGPGPIHQAAGHDATALFAPLHSPGIIEDRLDPSAYVGDVDPATLPPPVLVSPVVVEEGGERQIPLEEIIGLPDLDEAARRALSSKAWAYISAGGTDLYTLDLNRRAWNWVLFRPRVLVNVEKVDTSTTMLGQPTAVPFFICPTGMSKMAHAAGEPGLADAAAEHGVVQMVSTASSAPLEAIVGGRADKQVQFMQLYVDKNRANSEALLRRVNDAGMKAVFVTVDTAAIGKREADERNRASVALSSGITGGKMGSDKKGAGLARTSAGFIDPKLSWDDVAWLRKHTPLPIGVKGIQCVEDAVRCAEIGVDAIYLSNHGGRSLDTSPPALYTLLELRRLRPDVFEKCEVYVDGGIRRGTDVVKALCLGARGVGMGRPFLYALTYGTEGVHHAIEIMKDEVETTMRLLGVTKLSELGPHLLNTRALDSQVIDALAYGPREHFLPGSRSRP